jgi:hypothetical protein
MKRDQFEFDLQLFAESDTATGGASDGAGDTSDDNAQGDQNQTKNQEGQTYSKEELDKILQAQTDKRVTEALKTAQAKWEKEFKERLEQEKTEAEKLAKMSAEERRKAEDEKAKRELEAERAKLDEERRQFLKTQLELETTKELSTRNLPPEFAAFLLGEDAEATKNNLDVFEKLFKEQVQKGVEGRLKSTAPPKTGAGNNNTGPLSLRDAVGQSYSLPSGR